MAEAAAEAAAITTVEAAASTEAQATEQEVAARVSQMHTNEAAEAEVKGEAASVLATDAPSTAEHVSFVKQPQQQTLDLGPVNDAPRTRPRSIFAKKRKAALKSAEPTSPMQDAVSQEAMATPEPFRPRRQLQHTVMKPSAPSSWNDAEDHACRGVSGGEGGEEAVVGELEFSLGVEDAKQGLGVSDSPGFGELEFSARKSHDDHDQNKFDDARDDGMPLLARELAHTLEPEQPRSGSTAVVDASFGELEHSVRCADDDEAQASQHGAVPDPIGSLIPVLRTTSAARCSAAVPAEASAASQELFSLLAITQRALEEQQQATRQAERRADAERAARDEAEVQARRQVWSMEAERNAATEASPAVNPRLGLCSAHSSRHGLTIAVARST